MASSSATHSLTANVMNKQAFKEMIEHASNCRRPNVAACHCSDIFRAGSQASVRIVEAMISADKFIDILFVSRRNSVSP
jgi:hypothetical protein